jgi:hypothetical protein
MIYHIVYKIQQFVYQQPGVYFLFFTKVDKCSVYSIAARSPLIFINQGPVVGDKVQVLTAELVQLGANCLEKRCHCNCFVHRHWYIADAEFHGVKEWMYAKIPPDLLGIIDTICFDEQVNITVVIFYAVETIRDAGPRKFVKHFVRKDLYPVTLPSQKGELQVSA